MTALRIELEWCRDSAGYKLVEVPNRGKFIVGKGGRPILYRPFEMADAPLIAFANAHTAEMLLEFAARYGYLTRLGFAANGEVRPPMKSVYRMAWDNEVPIFGRAVEHLQGESVDESIALTRLFKRVLASPSGKLSRSLSQQVEALLLDAGLFDDVSFKFNVDPQRRFQGVISPSNLISGLAVRLAQMAGGRSYKTCELASCGALFPVGGRSALRADAKFCSSAHRVDHNSKKRAKNYSGLNVERAAKI